MSKRVLKALILTLLICVFSLCALASCVSSEKQVSSIQIVQGSFKESYNLDEGLNLTNAKILVTYLDGTSENVSVTQGMVSGFDTSKTTTGATLTITYREVSVNFIYKVANAVSIDTSFRYQFEVTDGGASSLDVAVKAINASKVEGGVYAMRFTVSTTGGIALSDFKVINDKFSMEYYQSSVSSVVFVVYSIDGYEPVVDNSTIITLKATKPSVLGTLNVQNASISDGEQDFVVPAITYTYGG
ncbi:MAG: bacterial Ig-like domain-containing protein [Clostridia bacterium]|nr:bacterial Ig-like domain-containing protein [Clostridia bacterium]